MGTIWAHPKLEEFMYPALSFPAFNLAEQPFFR